MRPGLPLALTVCLATGCTTYPLAKDVKMVSFADDVTTGPSVGPVRGESCQDRVLGFPIGDRPTIDQAFIDVRQSGPVRYLNNVATSQDGFDAIIFAHHCLVVTGVGYR
jgi:hypothetical protein